MKLTNEGIKDRAAWEAKGYSLPKYNREEIIVNTKQNPVWIHFGAGNIFRAFQANVVEELINQGVMNTGLIVAEGYDYEIIEKYNRPCDDLSILATLKADGTVEKKVIGSIVESCILDEEDEREIERLREIFRNPSLQMVSFTITEKGYKTRAYMDKVVGLILERFKAGAFPISIVSMDNCSHNGDKLKEAVVEIAKDWYNEGKCDNDFVNYITNPSVVAFPLTMIDKITPRPDDTVKKMLIADGVEGAEPIVTSKNTYVANFVNAEETEYLVIEDLFPNGRPALEKGGVIFTDRETVDKTEKMKVCTCLNPLHTALAIFGCLLGYNTIHDEMEDEALKRLVTKLGKEEGMKVVVDPKVLSPDEFLDAVLTKRLPNPFMPDTPQRIACDTSQKLPIRFGETIKAYRSSSSLSTESLKIVPLVLAGYLRYLEGIDDNGKQFEQSPDPLLEELKGLPAKDVLKRQDVFGVDLYSDGLAKKVLAIHSEMKGVGNIRKELEAV
ncbi:mannitol dehydrogenase family protein [Pseudobutyrivibrio xylanivorans]|uniref:Mannitol dehydrogenase family protein n=1 Tax=Pseudobutyrivibrio xylanivorans TaxID=185007 RepID=A0A5P6VME0_PSEXY|nr:mannitol dehydrogenase family protein [Pseudobutyrivibrio xylanivorans]QFJ53836.1 mannitol dehydrogenase family protein [Pseudobutyrivibrio xylanivorans]